MNRIVITACLLGVAALLAIWFFLVEPGRENRAGRADATSSDEVERKPGPAGAKAPQPAATTTRYEVVVVDRTGRVPGARVLFKILNRQGLHQYEGVTDPDGMWHSDSPAGSVVVEVHGPYPGQYAKEAMPDEDLNPRRIHVTLPPPGVRGRVVDNRGRPIPGAMVRWRAKGEWQGDGVRVGKDGYFEIGLGKPSTGRELVTYSPPFYPKAIREAMLPRDPLFELVPRPLIKGICTSPQGEPLAGVELRLMLIGDAKRTASLRAQKDPWAARLFEIAVEGADGIRLVRSDVVVRSRGDGRFTAQLPFPGLVRATASGKGLVFSDFDVDMSDGGAAEETVILESSGRVNDLRHRVFEFSEQPVVPRPSPSPAG